ncbi:MAG: YkgJ family cysteine cluster protein [Lachnospiraceae bacterium]|nr:YkgJ family cysteine cluster protein [Lachnospiraceae bacterium]
MRRDIRIEELQKLYTCHDMAKADCGGCHGCSACCQGMGNSVTLDPYDMYQLQRGLGVSPQALMSQGVIEMSLADGLVLPNLSMTGEKEQCVFLNEEGRCRIHSFRPGLCRLFPLGRVYDEEGFKYYVQLYECPKLVKTKVKIDKWLGIPDIKKYEEFVLAWHWLQKWCQELIEQAPDMVREDARKKVATSLLSIFYMTPYDGKVSFYEQFMARRDMFVRQIR